MRTVDRTKKSNIKCEHCKWWFYARENGDNEYWCHNKKSEQYKILKEYYHKCGCFEWK